jgi:hypothetical protein
VPAEAAREPHAEANGEAGRGALADGSRTIN